MFQYNDKNEISNTYFVDLQLPKWGSIAQDLYYFLLSSTSLDIKTEKFDYFVWFYHSELVKHLKLLNYSKKLPTLRSIRNALNKYSGWGKLVIIVKTIIISSYTYYLIVAFICSISVMGVVLLDPTDDADFDKIISNEHSNFTNSIYTNPRYRRHMKVVLPWLQHRGALE